jgi:hypothetical protein
MEFLREQIDFASVENKIVMESIGEGKKEKTYWLNGIHCQCEKKNQNGRIYPKPIMEREIKKLNETKIKQNRFISELGHPADMEIHFDKISHNTTKLVLEGNDGIGHSKILSTPSGLIARVLMDDGILLGMSTRGIGTLKESVVQSDFNLGFIDIVTDPSCPDAWVQTVMEAKREWVIENGILLEKDISEAEKEVDKIIVEHSFSKEDKQAAFIKLFGDVINKIQRKHV